MEKKTILNIVLSFLLLIGIANSVTFYDSFGLTFTQDKPSNMKVMSSECQDSSCSNANPADVEYFKGDSIICWYDYGQHGDTAGFETCMDSYKLSGNTLDLHDCDTISDGCSGEVYLIAKYNNIESASFGYVNHFFTSGDTYMSNYFWQTNFNCESDVCVDVNPSSINFVKGLNAIAEIGQVNIINTDNDLFPVQVEVPVTLEETVCSAYQFSQPDLYRPDPPAGYSDYSADTLINLDITQESTGQTLYTDSITIPILADQCAGLAAFSWTPSASLENEAVNFHIETDVTDNQIVNSFTDWMEVIETIYPENLDGSCWTRAYDFTLSNIDSQDLTTSVAQISQGETLYAIFDSGAWRDETLTPMDYDVEVYFDSTLVYSNTFSSSSDVETYSVDLSDEIVGLEAGSYQVKLITTPNGNDCVESESVEQTQNLELLVPASYNVNFHVKDPDYNMLSDAQVNLELLSADDHYQTLPIFDETLTTNNNGLATFNDIIPGDYKYTVSLSGYTNVTNDIHIGGPMDIYVTLADGNTAPVIDLPDNFTQYYEDPIVFDIRDYITDFNDDISDLSYTYNMQSGSASASLDGTYFTITDTSVGNSVLEIEVEDPSGSTATDTTNIIFLDNQAPVINLFNATPDSGENPLTTTFTIDVFDADGDDLECELIFADGTNQVDSCSNLNNIQHTYTSEGTYQVELRVDDGFNSIVSQTLYIYVFDRVVENPTPIINYFTLTSSNDIMLPTDLTLSWDIEHNLNYSTNCSLVINNVSQAVSCATSSYNLNNFNVSGESTFEIIATDSEGNIEQREIIETFIHPADIVNKFEANLYIDDVVEPGEFNFKITSKNDSLMKRFVNIKPLIVCEDVNNYLKTNAGYLDSSAVTKSGLSVQEHVFKANTLDYKFKIPKDTSCTFKVILTDKYGSMKILEENVMFSYPQANETFTSVRGKGTDVIDYMSSSLVGDGLNTGYNSMTFNLVNNEAHSKDMSISMISQMLNLEHKTQVNLDSGETKRVSIPLFIDKNTKSGMYPVRYTIFDGTDTQTRYSYIKVN